MSSDDSDDEDYDAYAAPHNMMERRYPLHDCVEFEDVEALKVRKDPDLDLVVVR